MSEIREPQMGFGASLGASYVRAKPFLKWAGGKQRLLPQYAPFLPTPVERYFEPFLGGGAVFFHLQPSEAVLCDSNVALMEVYRVVRENVEELISSLRKHCNERGYYYRIRSADPSALSPVERVSRFIFLNRTCYNGLYRVNSKGRFNVPFGRYKNPTICDAEGLRAGSLALRPAKLMAADFEEALATARSGDLVYLDPPYHPLSQTANFTAYTRDGFSEQDQRRLASCHRELDRHGCLLMLSNSDTPLIRELYGSYKIIEITARRAINSDPEGRGAITELLILNFEQG